MLVFRFRVLQFAGCHSEAPYNIDRMLLDLLWPPCCLRADHLAPC